MKQRFNKMLPAALLSTLALLAGGCEISPEDLGLIGDSFDVNEPGYVEPPQVADGCSYERFRQPAPDVTNKLDLLFVTDTSGSLNAERGIVADGVDAFIAALPAEVDYNVGVMLAHGSTSSLSGRLYQSGAEAVVLKSSEMALADLQVDLKAKLLNPSSDGATDGGEAGLYSISRALDADRLAEAQAKGFFRPDAAFVIVFVADENDICAEFPEGVVPVPDPQGKETSSFATDCGSVSAASTIAKIEAFAGEQPSLVAGIIYNNLNTVPAGGENEIGYGYTDAIKLANGLSVDLADAEYREGLEDIGQLAVVKFGLDLEFQLTENPAADIETSSVQAYVDGTAVPFSYLGDLGKVQLMQDNAGSPLSYVDVSYCVKQEPVDQYPLVADFCEGSAFAPRALSKVGLSIDPAQGSLVTTIVDGITSAGGVAPVQYSIAEIGAGDLLIDPPSVLIITRIAALNSVDAAYIQGVNDYIAGGGSVIAEEDGAALFFNQFEGDQPVMQNLNPAFEIFTGLVRGGGALLPIDASTTFVIDAQHPLMHGVPSNFLLGLRRAFAITGYDGSWLESSANFVSQGFLDLVPEGTYPAVLSGRCGTGRVVLLPMNHFNVIISDPIQTMLSNAMNWTTTGQ